MTEKQLRARDAKRDLGAELLESVRQMKRGAARTVYSPVVQARANAGVTQAQFVLNFGTIWSNSFCALAGSSVLRC